jgi:hypothetical protein
MDNTSDSACRSPSHDPEIQAGTIPTSEPAAPPTTNTAPAKKGMPILQSPPESPSTAAASHRNQAQNDTVGTPTSPTSRISAKNATNAPPPRKPDNPDRQEAWKAVAHPATWLLKRLKPAKNILNKNPHFFQKHVLNFHLLDLLIEGHTFLKSTPPSDLRTTSPDPAKSIAAH